MTISTSPRIFQQYMDKLLSMNRVRTYQDDILMGGVSKEEQDINLNKVLTVLKEHNLVVNEKRSEICKTLVHFLGFLLEKDKIKSDPEKLVTILNIASPTDHKQLKSILVTFQFYSRFTSMTSIAGTLYRLLNQNIPFLWTEKQETALRNTIIPSKK